MAWFFDWTPDEAPADVINIAGEGTWDQIHSRYSPIRENRPLRRVLEIAREHEVKSIVVEYRYIDADFRSEHSRFYSTTFARYPSVCHRLHFFADEVLDDLTNLSLLRDAYRGYSVMRPLQTAPVGRTMIAAPAGVASAVQCWAKDEVNLFGTSFEIESMPFVSQDAQYMRCAHSALWMVLYHAHLRHGMDRYLPTDVHDAALGGTVIGRQVPSDGLSPPQLLSALQALDMSAGRLELPESADEDEQASKGPVDLSVRALVHRYIDSQMPPIVYSKTHAWVLVAYDDESGLMFRHDDARGPFLSIASPWEEKIATYVPWKALIPPLPQKVYMTAERAAHIASDRLTAFAELGEDNEVTTATEAGDLRIRTFAMPSVHFKRSLTERVPTELGEEYRLSQLPRWLWVAELVNRSKSGPNVVGEILIDATGASHVADVDDPVVLAENFAGQLLIYPPDFDEILLELHYEFRPYVSARRARP